MEYQSILSEKKTVRYWRNQPYHSWLMHVSIRPSFSCGCPQACITTSIFASNFKEKCYLHLEPLQKFRMNGNFCKSSNQFMTLDKWLLNVRKLENSNYSSKRFLTTVRFYYQYNSPIVNISYNNTPKLHLQEKMKMWKIS